jgi:hypothetical protein
VTAFSRKSDGQEFLAPGQPAPVLSLRSSGTLHAPDSAAWDAADRRLTLRYGNAGLTATVRALAKPTHLTLELTGVTPAGAADLALWGPYPTRIRKTVGEVVGVVRDDLRARPAGPEHQDPRWLSRERRGQRRSSVRSPPDRLR